MTLQELVAYAASVHGDRTAVTYCGSVSGKSNCLLYKDLSKLAEELSCILKKSCSPTKGVIGLYCSDDLFVPVWILGILHCPAAYVPLDPDAPGLLSTRVIHRCGLKYCAVQTDLLKKFQETFIKYIVVEVCEELPKFRLTLIRVEPLPVSEQNEGHERCRAPTVEGADLTDSCAAVEDTMKVDLAYVLHTSGTTGVPKIVRVPHECILPNILHLRSLFQMSEEDVVFLASPLTFDPSVVDIFLALSCGAQLLIVPSVIKKIPSRLCQLLFVDHKTTVLQVTPTLLGRFGHRILKHHVLASGSSLRVLALGGEACPSPALLSTWRHEDNKSQIYNIYGITEVSCWACCYEIPESSLQLNNSTCRTVSSVPLGTPLMDTVVEVRDDHGCVVTEGEGQVFIGGEHRVCLLDDEEVVVPWTMRATGDWVNVVDSQLYYLGRRDRMIKRHGKRVNLDSLQQLILTLPLVEACAVGLHEDLRLMAFVVASTSGGQKAASLVPSVQRQADLHSSSVKHQQEDVGGADGDVSRLILKQLSERLPSYSVPDALLLVPALTLTPHGKVDFNALMKSYQTQTKSLQAGSSQGDFTRLKQHLQSVWQATLGLCADVPVDDNSNFLLSGGDSLKALILHDDILTTVGVTSPELLEIILDGTFSDVLWHITMVTLKKDTPEKSPSSLSETRKRRTDPSSAALAKRDRRDLESLQSDADVLEKRAFKVLRRASEVVEFQSRDEKSPAASFGVSSGETSASVSLGLSLSWSSDTGRCVDASPVLLVQDGTKTAVFIGSHSHRMQALDLDTGDILWERVLGDRIEASAAVSRCGTVVIIGCYDGCVYFLCAASGETRWVFETKDAVKCSPAVDPLTGLVVVGSHDGYVYALDHKDQKCAWKHHCGGGAVFSSPFLHPSHRRLYVASLGGRLLCINPDSGEALWSLSRDSPFFSSPIASCHHIVIGSADGNICCFGVAGEPLWQFETKEAVFSSPSLTPDQQRVMCGSHDGRLYCLNCADGSLAWTFQTTGRVYSSPCVFDGSAVGRTGILVAIASTNGTVWILDGHNGQLLASYTLPGELFSSPVVFEQSLIIGCRNDYVYCLKLNFKAET